MMIHKKIKKDIFLRKYFTKKESLNKILKILLRTKYIKYYKLLNIYFCIKKKQSFYTKIKNRCFITSRSYGVYSCVNLSRIKIKELINNSLIVGAKKYSW